MCLIASHFTFGATVLHDQRNLRMGGLLSNAMRVLKTYNIEQRAMNALSENRKVVPPKHPTTAPIIEQMKIGKHVLIL